MAQILLAAPPFSPCSRPHRPVPLPRSRPCPSARARARPATPPRRWVAGHHLGRTSDLSSRRTCGGERLPRDRGGGLPLSEWTREAGSRPSHRATASGEAPGCRAAAVSGANGWPSRLRTPPLPPRLDLTGGRFAAGTSSRRWRLAVRAAAASFGCLNHLMASVLLWCTNCSEQGRIAFADRTM
jgi:hypothetical protein